MEVVPLAVVEHALPVVPEVAKGVVEVHVHGAVKTRVKAPAKAVVVEAVQV